MPGLLASSLRLSAIDFQNRSTSTLPEPDPWPEIEAARRILG